MKFVLCIQEILGTFTQIKYTLMDNQQIKLSFNLMEIVALVIAFGFLGICVMDCVLK